MRLDHIVPFLWLAALLAASGCTLDRRGLAGPARDAAVDGMVGDASPTADADAEMPDANLPDGEVDSGLDGGQDAGTDDGGPLDSGPPDAGPDDAGPPDAGPPDSGPPDAGPPGPGCVDGTVEQSYAGGTMVGCDGALDQCTAETLCGSGWHLCTYSEFAGRGGDTVTATTIRWIASCGRLPGTCAVPSRPTDAICSASCSRAGDSIVTVGSVCGGSSIMEGDCPLGLVAHTLPMGARFGGESTCIRARPDWTTRLYGATCCR